MVTIDADLQDPPELIPDLNRGMEPGRRRGLRRAQRTAGRGQAEADHRALVHARVSPGSRSSTSRATPGDYRCSTGARSKHCDSCRAQPVHARPDGLDRVPPELRPLRPRSAQVGENPLRLADPDADLAGRDLIVLPHVPLQIANRGRVRGLVLRLPRNPLRDRQPGARLLRRGRQHADVRVLLLGGSS